MMPNMLAVKVMGSDGDGPRKLGFSQPHPEAPPPGQREPAARIDGGERNGVG
jgi:hypothetical protein